MELAKVNYGLNQAYYVDIKAFEQVAKNAVKKFKDYKLDDITVTMNQSQSNVKMSIVLLTPKTSVDYGVDLPAIEKSINEGVLNLIDGKPLNIKIQVKVGK